MLLNLPLSERGGRYSQGIYQFDQDFYSAILATEAKGTLPAEVFYNLPEWCVH